MKTLSGLLMFILLGGVGLAQQPAPRAVTEIAVSSEKLVKNSPFSADAVSESVQTLADGNRIVRSSTSKLYRNSEGRFRREMFGGSGGGFGSLYTVGQGVTILDPVGGFRYMIDPELRTTRQFTITPRSEVKVLTGVNDKIRAELKAAAAAQQASGSGESRGSVSQAALAEKIRAEVDAAAAGGMGSAVQTIVGSGTGFSGVFVAGSRSKWETRTEELGTQNIEGVDAEGTRTITTIPAGAIGNELPIEITYEKWYSRELQLVVMSKHNDPRYGEQTYRLTNINRSEPDPSLFTPPQGYRLVTEPKGSYTYTTAAKAAEKAAAARTVSVSATKASKP